MGKIITNIITSILLVQLLFAKLVCAEENSLSACLLKILDETSVDGQTLFKSLEKTHKQIAEELNGYIVSSEKAKEIYHKFRSAQMEKNDIEIFKYLVDNNLFFRKIYFQLGHPKEISITLKELGREIDKIASQNSALKFVQTTAEDLNLEVSLSGFNAFELANYAKIILRSQRGDFGYLPSKLVNNFSNIFTYQNDFTLNFIIKSSDTNKTEQFKEIIRKKFPFAKINFGNTSNDNFLNPVIDITTKTKSDNSFLGDIIDGKISLPAEKAKDPIYRTHDTVLEVLTVASRFELELTDEMKVFLKNIINDFDPKIIKGDDNVNFDFQKKGLKIFFNSTNLDHTYKIIQEIDPTGKLAITPPEIRSGEFADGAMVDFFNKKPLSTSPDSKVRVIDKTIVGDALSHEEISNNMKQLGKRAQELEITVVNHVTKKPETYAAMTRSPRGIPISYVSRQHNPGKNAGSYKGELAQRGEGFYTSLGDSHWSEYGDYAVYYQVPANAVNGIDFKLYQREFFTSTQESLLVKEMDEIDIVESFKKLFEGEIEDEFIYYQQQWKNITDLAFDPQKRELLDKFVQEQLEKTNGIYEISQKGLEEYLQLPVENTEGKKTLNMIMRKFMLAENNRDLYMHAAFDDYLSIIINSPHASTEFKDLVKWHLSSSQMNTGSGFFPYIYSPLLKEDWFIDYVKNSPYKENFLKILNKNDLPWRKNVKDLREFIKKIE